MAALQFAWQTAKNIYVTEHQLNDKSKEYQVHGPLFFGSVANFKSLFSFDSDPVDIIIDFKYSRVADHSAIEAIQYVVTQYSRQGKILHLRHLSAECKALLGKAGNMVEVNVLEDPDYHVATNKLD